MLPSEKMAECWKPIPIYCNYHVSNQGKVRSYHLFKNGKEKITLLKPLYYSNKSEQRVKLYDGKGNFAIVLIQDLVADAFVPREYLQATMLVHINGLIEDNRAHNLT